MVALSYAATDRGRRALRTVSEAETSVRAMPSTERVRARILARLGGADAPAGGSVGRVEALEPTSVEAAVDLAAAGLWMHRLDAAEQRSRAAVHRAPAHPEANWLRGLVLRMRGARDNSEPYFRRSWRAQEKSPRLALELGYVHLAEQQYERARDLFFRALLADPGSLEAIRGLGRAYHGFAPSKGKWNFQRILENYESDEDRAVHAAEVHRWLAVFLGSRSGAEEALEHLERARSLAGDRPRLLLEFARYRESRGALEAAHTRYMEALERDATLAPAHLGLAKIAGKRDNTRGKRTHLRRYLDLHPEGTDADWAREALRELRESTTDGEE
jgi:tetratricopeptide (TPR) repeat protein